MTRLAPVLILLAGGVAHAGCPVVVKAAPVYHAPAVAAYVPTYHTPYVAQVLTLAVPVAVVTPYPVAAAPAAAPAESAELRSLREEVAGLKAAQQRAALKEELRAELLRELQPAPKK